MLIGNAVERTEEGGTRDGKTQKQVVRKGTSKKRPESIQDTRTTEAIPFPTMLRGRIRYFTDGAVIGSRGFVNEAFVQSRDRFGPKRRDGARRMRGNGTPAGELVWSLRDLRSGI
jgi:hypothetical protein